MILTINVIEKWSENPVPFTTVLIGVEEFIADEDGRISVNVPKGQIGIKVTKNGYVDRVYSPMIVADTNFSIILTPVLEAL